MRSIGQAPMKCNRSRVEVIAMSKNGTGNLSIEQMDQMSLLHPATSIADLMKAGPTIVEEAQGLQIKTRDGRELMDLCSGLWCVNVGYGRNELGEAAAEAMSKMGYYHLFAAFSNEPAIRLADKVLDLLHTEAGATHLSKVFFGTSGSDANETAYKLVRYYNNIRGRPEKKKFISRHGAYHGVCVGSGSLTGVPSYHKAWDLPIDGVFHTLCPHYYRYAEKGETESEFTERLISELEALIVREGAETIAAFIAEPIMGTGGVFLPSADYFEHVQEILKKNDILFIADEVITGFCRTGHWFATGLYDLKPDIVTMAKGITSAYFPVSASVISEEIWSVLNDTSETAGPLMHGFTYTGHPVGATVALKNIEILEREDLAGNAQRVGAYFLERLRNALADHPYVGDVRGEGLLIGVELVADKASRKWFRPEDGAHKLVFGKLMEEGIISRPLPMIEVMCVAPPLVMTYTDADEAAERYARGLAAAMPDLTRLSAY